MSSNTFLDIDDSLFKSKLRLPEKDEEEEKFNKMIDSLAHHEKPSILVYPSPGICIKVKSKTGEKTFINVCISDEIPPPEEISQENLLKIIMDEDSSYVIPLSIGQERLELDKSGKSTPTYDVLINKNYFDKCLEIKSFMMFTLIVIIDGVSDKYNKLLNPKDHVVLKNRKVIGKLQPHRIEKRNIKKPTELTPSRPIIQEIEKSKTPKLQVTDETNLKPLEYVILKDIKNEDGSLIGLFKIPSLLAQHVSVDVGEDRVIVEDHASDSFINVFLSNSIDEQNVKAYMDSKIGILRLHMPPKNIK